MPGASGEPTGARAGDAGAIRTVVEPPDARQLLRRVAAFLREDLYPAQTDDRLRFRTLVAANAVSIAEREIFADGHPVDPDGYVITDEILAAAGSLSAYSALFRSGDLRITDPDTYETLRRYVEMKLAVGAPGSIQGLNELPTDRKERTEP